MIYIMMVIWSSVVYFDLSIELSIKGASSCNLGIFSYD